MTRRVKKFNSEDSLHWRVAQYIRSNYPTVIFRTDFAAGIKLTPGQAKKHKSLQSGRAYPDLFIAQPKRYNNIITYAGLYIELKKEGATLYKKDGTLSSNKHIQEQYSALLELTTRGYYADFAQGFESAKKLIDWYLGKHES